MYFEVHLVLMPMNNEKSKCVPVDVSSNLLDMEMLFKISEAIAEGKSDQARDLANDLVKKSMIGMKYQMYDAFLLAANEIRLAKLAKAEEKD